MAVGDIDSGWNCSANLSLRQGWQLSEQLASLLGDADGES
jgi:hypothetical protein